MIMQGSRVLVFDPRLFKDDKTTPFSITMKPATVVFRYGYVSQYWGWKYDDVVDVVFDHDPHRISRGHFTKFVIDIC